MKILFLISTIGKKQGHGGHYYSLKTTFDEVNKQFDCLVINVGRQPSPVIDSINGKVFNVKYSLFNPVNVFFHLKKIIENEKPDIIHSFDANALFFARVLSFIYKIPHVHTKCGGPNPPRYYPFVKNFIVYSEENFIYFQAWKKFSGSNFYLIPNRIGYVEQDIPRINKIKLQIPPDRKIFLRITRLSNYYRDSIFQSINLIKLLNHQKYPCQLVLIGVNQDHQLLDELLRLKDEDITILTDEYYTTDASALIDIGDFVIGTGRGFMEAASRGKVLLAPLQDSDIPLLITEKNFSDVMNKNFSERTSLGNFNYNENLTGIVEVMQSAEKYTELSTFLKLMSTDFFEITSKAQLYSKIYATTQYEENLHVFDFLVHFAVFTSSNF
jgi:hypothetical protein